VEAPPFRAHHVAPGPHPREPGLTLLIDFDSAGTAPAAFDLAFLLPTFWSRAQRAAHEDPFLRRYHEALQRAGVGLRWQDLVDDYRAMVAFMVFDPVFDATNGSARGYWEPKMRCLIDAYSDLGCADL
jgi:hypothetical protein